MGKYDFRYFDMHSNVYSVEKLKVEYNPITKEQSYTGKYDGGKSAKGKVTQKQLDKINAKIQTIVDSKSMRIKHRSGQCAMLIIYLEDKVKRYILPESVEQKKLDDLMRAAVGIS